MSTIPAELDTIEGALKRIRDLLGSQQGTPVTSGDDVGLQTALDGGGRVILEAGGNYRGSFQLTTPGTILQGNGATLENPQTGYIPALDVLPGVSNVEVSDLFVKSAGTMCVLVGRNTREEQGTLDLMPRGIRFTRVVVPTHRNLRGFELHGACELIDCEVRDHYQVGAETKGINLLNSPGPLLVQGGVYESGSISILIGGDEGKIPGIVPSDITIKGTQLVRPLAWQTDGVRRGVKTGLELKAGHRVTVEDVLVDGVWKDAQDGWAVTLTPRSGGSIRDVMIRRLTARHCGGIANIMGRDYATYTPEPTGGVVFEDGVFQTDRAQFGGRGVLALLTSAVADVTFRRIVMDSVEGTPALIQADRGTMRTDAGDVVQADNMGTLTIEDSLLRIPRYGLSIGGSHYGTPNPLLTVHLTNNAITEVEARTVRNLDASNRTVDRAEFDRLVAERVPA
jgi:hypothetical protein